MILTGSKQRVCIGGWVLAALLLAGLNAYQFMALEQQPLMGYSQTIKMLQVAFRQFDTTLAAGDFSLEHRMDFLNSWTSTIEPHNPSQGRSTSNERADVQAPASDPALPILSGIMQVMGPHGALEYQAVLNGRVYREKDKIDAFSVDRISSTGVVVRRSGRQWLIKSPTPYYSSDQGE